MSKDENAHRDGGCSPTTCSRRFVPWAGTGWERGWAGLWGGDDMLDVVFWPIVDVEAGHKIEGYPRPNQWFAVAFSSETQSMICDALNASANAKDMP